MMETEPGVGNDRLRENPDAPEETEGGEPACWAHLTCDECGAVSGEDHRDGCSSR